MTCDSTIKCTREREVIMRNFLVIGNLVTTVAGSKIISLNAEKD